MSAEGKAPPGDVGFNYVPLIDVTFNLIIFFVLTSEISTAQNARVLIPNPFEPQAQNRKAMGGHSAMVAVVSEAKNLNDMKASGNALRYEVDGLKVDGKDPQSVAEVIKRRKAAYEALTGVKDANSEFFVEVRADSRLSFDEVAPVIEAIAGAGIRKMAISTRTTGESK